LILLIVQCGYRTIYSVSLRHPLYTPRWSPDGRALLVADAQHRLWAVSALGDRVRQVAHDPHAEIRDARFSPDERWVAYSETRPNQMRALHLQRLSDGHDVVISAVMEDDHDPVFSADGRRLLFLSSRHEVPFVSDRDREGTIASLKSDGLYSLVLPQDFQADATAHGEAPGLTAQATDMQTGARGGFADLEVTGDDQLYQATATSGMSEDLCSTYSLTLRIVSCGIGVDGSGPGARVHLRGPRQCLRVDILPDVRHFAISNGNGEDPIVLERPIRGYDSSPSEADDQNPVSLRYEFGGLWE
jgi:WD40-like Beta Propeller Repeat